MRIALLLLLPLFLFASKAFVELDIDRGQRFFVSKKFIATLKVETTAFSISNLDVNLESSDDVVVIAPSSASYKSSEEIGGERYQYSAYEYELYPLKPGGLSLKPFKVSFDVSSGYGQPREHFELQTSQKEIFVSSVKGVDGFILATPKLTVKTAYSERQKAYKLGDAITQTITISAVDVPDVLIPTLAFADIEGVKRYEDESRLSQEKKGGRLVSRRVQSATYLFNRDGNFTLPSHTLKWYDTQTSRVATARTEPYSFEVIDTTRKAPDAKAKSAISYKQLFLPALGVMAGMLFLVYGIIRYRKRDKDRFALVKRINP